MTESACVCVCERERERERERENLELERETQRGLVCFMTVKKPSVVFHRK